jgi:hypothetical protein
MEGVEPTNIPEGEMTAQQLKNRKKKNARKNKKKEEQKFAQQQYDYYENE